MSNLIPFRTAGALAVDDERDDFVANPAPHSHVVQFYESDGFLFDTVGRFLAAGLRAGDGLIVIASAAHRDGIIGKLENSAAARAIADGQLILLDARETLSRFMIGDMPDADLFRDLIHGVIGAARGARPSGNIRAYGEMVDLLWRDGNSRAAIRLEELWNEAGEANAFTLLCAYVMGNFYKEGDAARFMEVCRNHSHVIPSETFTKLDDPLARLREISLLQQHARNLENELQHRRELESALRDALRERGRAEEELRACVKREKEARERAEASDSFKEMFLGILSHDLRNPLNTVLTSARLMRLRGAMAPDDNRRIERIVSSGERMDRMIEQLMDVARARLTDGIPVDRAGRHDLVPLVVRIADEARAANPSRAVDVRTAPCTAQVDPDRFEQVVSNLVGNAITHGDEARPVTITLGERAGVASLAVHNFGKPIDPALMPILFDPFKRGEQPKGSSVGLGLGLYIVERIVSAHGGKVHVHSSADAGTQFEVVLPQSADA